MIFCFVDDTAAVSIYGHPWHKMPCVAAALTQ